MRDRGYNKIAAMKVYRRYTGWATHSLPGLPGTEYAEEHQHYYTIVVEGKGDPPYAVDMEKWDAEFEWIARGGASLSALYGATTTVEWLAAHWLDCLPGATMVKVQEDEDRWAVAER